MKPKQLFEKEISGYKPVYPLISLQAIVDEESSTTLAEVFAKYNHVYATFQDTIAATRCSVPDSLRHYGLWLSYELNGTLYTEWFKGSNVDAKDDDIWSNDDYWTYVPEAQVLNVDEEDLTTEYNLIKFKDREYDPYNYSGKGYKILRKDFVDGVNILVQDDFDSENTIYEIRYNFDLQGATITLPENATLLFIGGTLNNGTVTFDGGTILGVNTFEDCGDATFDGMWDEGLIMTINSSPMWWNGSAWSEIGSGGSSTAYSAEVTSVTTTNGDASATVALNDNTFEFTFDIPKGDKGDTGATGAAGTIEDFDVTATAVTSSTASASVNVSDNTMAFTFGIPSGGSSSTSIDIEPLVYGRYFYDSDEPYLRIYKTSSNLDNTPDDWMVNYDSSNGNIVITFDSTLTKNGSALSNYFVDLTPYTGELDTNDVLTLGIAAISSTSLTINERINGGNTNIYSFYFMICR